MVTFHICSCVIKYDANSIINHFFSLLFGSFFPIVFSFALFCFFGVLFSRLFHFSHKQTNKQYNVDAIRDLRGLAVTLAELSSLRCARLRRPARHPDSTEGRMISEMLPRISKVEMDNIWF